MPVLPGRRAPWYSAPKSHGLVVDGIRVIGPVTPVQTGFARAGNDMTVGRRVGLAVISSVRGIVAD